MMSFHEPAELYILTHSILPVPDWLKERFVVDDHTNLHVGWQLGLVRNLTAYLSLNFIRMKNSHMKVRAAVCAKLEAADPTTDRRSGWLSIQMWRLKDGIMAKGGKITLPGLGLGRRLSPGFNYVVCWKHSSEQTLTSAGRRMSTRYKSKEVPC